MIKLTQLSNLFENGLNTLLAAELGTGNIKFKIWAEAGKYKKAHREGNTVTQYINGNIRTSTSANDANSLVMGVNGLSLEFAIPVQQPRTNPMQTAEELQLIEDGQFQFVQHVVNAINSYFQTARVESLKDGNGTNFTVAYQSGTVISGAVDLASRLGNYLSVSVYIEVFFIENGLSSKNVIVYFDDDIPDSEIPFMAVRHGRTPMLENDVYVGSLVSKSIVTSSAFAIDIDVPLHSDGFTKSCLDYLLDGEPNVAHFVTAVFGTMNSKKYLMTLNTVQTSATGISVAGCTASLMEVMGRASVVNVPDSYQVARIEVDSSELQSIEVTSANECTAFIAGEVVAFLPNAVNKIALTPDDIEYNNTDDKYYVYCITNRQCTFVAPDNVEIVKSAK